MPYGYKRLLWTVLLGVLLLGGSRSAAAQQQKNLDTWFERGMTAFDEARYDDAAEAFNWVVDRDRDQAEAHYMLARVYLAQDDLKEADRAIGRALKREPENRAFLEIKLEIGFPRELIPPIRETRQRELAEKLLALDPNTVTSNLRLGVKEEKVFLHSRNRITLVGLRLYPAAIGSRQSAGPLGERVPKVPDQVPLLSDIFDLDAQRNVGVEVLDLSKPADKAYPRAVEYFERALASDPARREVYTNLAALYAVASNHAAMQALVATMRRHFPQDPYTWLYLGYAEYRSGRMEAARQHFQVARGFMPPAMSAAFEDVTGLLNNEQKKRAEQDPGFSPASFWQRRDPRFLTGYNERRLEHYARLVYAGLLFSEPKLDLRGWDSDRGRIYLRYGAPQAEFFASNAIADCGMLLTINNFHVFDYGDVRLAFGNAQRNLNEFPLYSPCANASGHIASLGAKLDYVMIARETIRKEPERYEHDPPGSRVAFPYLVNVFKGSAGHADLLVPYGVPVPFKPERGVLALSLRTGGFVISDDGLLDEARRTVAALDTRQILTFAENTLWIDVHHLTAPPGRHEVSIEFETETGAIVGFHRSEVEAPDYRSGVLQVSDVLLAYGVEEAPGVRAEGTISRKGFLITPAPWGVYKAGQPLYFYFETYNLTQDADGATRYNVEAVLVEKRSEKGIKKLIQQAFGGKERVGVSAGFEDSGVSPDEGQYLILDTREQPPGAYLLVVRVTDTRTGQTAEAQRAIILE